MVRDINVENLQDLANRLRIQCIKATEASKSGYDTEKLSGNFLIFIRNYKIYFLYNFYFKISLRFVLLTC